MTHFPGINPGFSMLLLPFVLLQFKNTLDDTKYLKLELIVSKLFSFGLNGL